MRVQIVSFGAQFALLAIWGLLMGLAFPTPNFWLFSFFALTPLGLLAIRGKPSRRRLLLTYLAGFLWWAVMVRWLYQVTGAGYFGVSAYLALYLPAFVGVAGIIHRRLAIPATLGIPLVWVGLEYVRGLALTGFPWFLLGHSQPTVMIQIADIFGAYGVSFVVAMTGGLLIDLSLHPLVRRDGTGRARMGRMLRQSLLGWSVVMAATLTYGIWRIHTTPPAKGGLLVAVVQSDVPQSNKMSPSVAQRRKDFRALMKLQEDALAGQPRLIVCPETIVPAGLNGESLRAAAIAGEQLEKHPPDLATELGQHIRDDLERTKMFAEAHRTLGDFARTHRVHLLVGAHRYTDWQLFTVQGWTGVAPQPDKTYNTAFCYDANGRIAGYYDKIHRVPFGEYVPWVENWPWAKRLFIKYLTPYNSDYSLTPGDQYKVLTLCDGQSDRPWRIAAPICFEDVISYVCLRACYGRGGKRVDLLVNLTNDGWYPGTAEAYQHEQIARFRCVENRVPMVRAVNRGVSGFIDSAGRIVGVVSRDGERQNIAGTALRHCPLDRRSTLFGWIGKTVGISDWFGLTCLILTGLLVVLAGLLGRAERARS